MAVMTYDTWMSETKRGIFTPRSSELKEIDKALDTYTRSHSPADLTKLKTAIDAWIKWKGADWRNSTRNSNGTVALLLQQVIDTVGPILKRGYDLVNISRSVDQEIAVSAIDAVKTAVTRAQWAAGLAGNNQREKHRLEKWFGAGVKHSEIRGVYDRIVNGISHGARLIRDDDPGESGTYAYVRPSESKAPPRIYLCGAFWKHGQISWLRVGGGWSKKDHRMCNDNPLGVVVHELTHLFAATEDHVYGRTECKQLAISNHTEARENADNFEYYCEDVLLGKY